MVKLLRNWFRLLPIFLLLICSGLGSKAGIGLGAHHCSTQVTSLAGQLSELSIMAKPLDQVDGILYSLRIPKSTLELALEGIIELDEEDDESEKKSAQKIQQVNSRFDLPNWTAFSESTRVQVPDGSQLPTLILFVLHRNFRL